MPFEFYIQIFLVPVSGFAFQIRFSEIDGTSQEHISLCQTQVSNSSATEDQAKLEHLGEQAPYLCDASIVEFNLI